MIKFMVLFLIMSPFAFALGLYLGTKLENTKWGEEFYKFVMEKILRRVVSQSLDGTYWEVTKETQNSILGGDEVHPVLGTALASDPANSAPAIDIEAIKQRRYESGR